MSLTHPLPPLFLEEVNFRPEKQSNFRLLEKLGYKIPSPALIPQQPDASFLTSPPPPTKTS